MSGLTGGLLYLLAVRLWACLLIGCLFAAKGADAQVPYSFPANYPYLLRLERESSNTNTCVLLKKDGSYHYEKNHNEEHVTIYEGELNQEAMADIARWLRQPDLLSLKQSDIASPLFAFDLDIVNVFRGDHWQDLEFADSKDHRSVVPTVASLMDWLATVPRLPHRELTEFEGRNNCLTEHKIELRVRPAAPPLPPPAAIPESPAPAKIPVPIKPPSNPAFAETATPPPDFLLWMSVVRFGDPMQRRCVLVSPNGHYHAEKSSQSSGSRMVSQVLEGILPDPVLDTLRQILAAPDWENEYVEQLPLQVIVLSGEMIEVRLPGEGHVLRSAFLDVDYQKIDAELSRNQIEDLAAVPGSHERVVAPLRAWFKKNVEDARGTPVRNGVSDLCSPP